jgi:hypothetical protein
MGCARRWPSSFSAWSTRSSGDGQRRRRISCILTLAAALAVGGCAGLERPLATALEAPAAVVGDCARWYAALDDAVDRAGVRDGGSYRVPGFPYLRVDRFSASFAAAAEADPRAFAAWTGRLRELDAAARRYELKNLPPRQLAALGVPDTAAAIARAGRCADVLQRHDLASPGQAKALVERARVPDDYRGWNRVLGLYPIAGIPFSVGVARWHKDTIDEFRRKAAGTEPAPHAIRYRPEERPLGPPQVRSILARGRLDALGIPHFSAADRARLLAGFAPVFAIETIGADDRFGPLYWAGGPAPSVDVARPIVYRRLAFTRWRDRVLVQLVYTIWFPERPASGALDLLSGRLDGLVFRVTLDPEGNPLVYDSIHPCGCYHMFFPTARVTPKPSPEPGIEWVFVPQTLPAIDASQRLVVRLASGTHYIVGLGFDRGDPGVRYRFADDDGLRALPSAAGGTRSAFGPDGIVPGTERAERFLYWPMGIADPGAMRQWGRQATAFLGRRHFDDPDLIERRFAPAGASSASRPVSNRIAAAGSRIAVVSSKFGL